MTQDGSSISSDVAADGAPAPFRDLTEAQKVQLEDADALVSEHICEQLDEAIRADELLLADGEYSPEKYSLEIRDLLRRAWTIAAQFQHRAVAADHIIIGMITGDETVGAPSPSKFADAGVDLASLWTRTIAHFANLPTPPAVADLYVPTQRVAPDVVKWIGGAMQIALTRDQDRYDLAPDDLIQIVQSARDPDHPFHDPLKDVIDRFYPSVPLPAAAQAPVMLPALGDSPPAESGSGGLPSTEIGSRALLTRISTGFEEANRAIRSAQHTASCARTEVRRLKEALVVRIPAGSNSAEQHLTQLRTRVDELRIRLADIDARTTEIKNGQLIDLAVAIGDCRSQLTDVGLRTGEIKDTQLTALDRSVANCRNHLSELGRNTAAIRDRLPRPPAGPWIALAIVGVVVFGLALGIALSDPSSLGAVFRLALPPS